MNVHFIAIGGAIMHNLALNFHAQGHKVTGSDDVIYGISKERLDKYGLLPIEGWFPDRIHKDLDLIILGMHAKKDNPELARAKELDLTIMSFPEYVASCSKEKVRCVIAGSHGKTSTTAMILHVFRKSKLKADYLVGAQLPEFERMVHLSDAPIIIIEGDEYLSSCLDDRPKIMHYDPDITVITGIAWDHMNVFPTEDAYAQTFANYLKILREKCKVFYDKTDKALDALIKKYSLPNIESYEALEENGQHIKFEGNQYPIEVFGEHNRKNMMAALLCCQELGIPPKTFLQHISDFSGAKFRLEKIHESEDLTVYKDFAHAPSKVKATLQAVRDKYAGKKIAVLQELHTYSSLNKQFIPQYKGALKPADIALVCYDPEAIKVKRMEAIDPEYVKACYDDQELHIARTKNELELFIQKTLKQQPDVILILSSGNFFGIDILSFI